MKPKLGDYEIREAGKFSGENGLVIRFSEHQVATLISDNSGGKSTALDFLSILLGRSVKQVEIDALVNKFSGKIDGSIKFRGKSGQWYEVTRTKSQYYLRHEGEKKDLSSPQATIIEELGYCAYNPHKYQSRPIGDLVKYLVPFNDKKVEDWEREDKRLKEAGKSWEEARATANKEAKARITILEGAGYCNDKGEIKEAAWVAAEKKYASPPPPIETLSKALTKANLRAIKYAEAELRVKSHKDKKSDLEAKIAALQAELAIAQNGIIAGEQWLEENKADKTNAAAIQKQYDNAAIQNKEYEAWLSIKAKKAEMDEFDNAAKIADSKAKKAERERKELQLSVIPECRGIEFVLEDEPDRNAGFYADGFNALQMSGTQYLVAILKILRKLKCRILLLDSISDFGSDFAAILEQLKKEGWYILLTQTKQSQSLTIEYDN